MRKKLLLVFTTCMVGITSWALATKSGVLAMDAGDEDTQDEAQVALKDGYYQIGSAADLAWFANEVNNGSANINAQLTADIDFTGNAEMIGNGTNYTGTFDGQYHTVTVNYTATIDRTALFRYIDGATICNLTVGGENTAGYSFAAGVVGGVVNTPATLKNVVSKVKIHSTKDGDNTYGGIIGNCGGATLQNCIFAGEMDRMAKEDGSLYSAQNSGGLVGWCGGKTYFVNCMNLGKMDLAVGWNAIFGRDGSNAGNNAKTTNCYYSETYEWFEGADGYTPTTNGATQITEEMAKSGELCFLLNGNQSELNWFQTLGEDEMPSLDKTRKAVYANGHVSCAGEPIGSVTYSNDPAGMNQDDHLYEYGVCVECGDINPDFCKQDAEGWYNIGTAEELVWFANTVNTGVKGMKGKLTDDIDMSSVNDVFPMIGVNGHPFTDGTFDGQFHHIMNLNINRSTEEYVGLFGSIQGNTDISNLILDKSCYMSGVAFMGIVGGSNTAGTFHLTNLGMEGTIEGSAQNIAGIYGCNYGSYATCYIDHCYVTGAVRGARESAAISGWMGGKGGLTNSWSIAEVEGHDANQPFGRNCLYTNCWTNIAGHTHAGMNLIPNTEMALTGELAYLMNGNSIENPVWFQTLGEDEHPVWDNTHGIVYKLKNIGDIHDEASLGQFLAEYGPYLTDISDNTIATQSLLDELTAMADNMPSASTLEEFMPTYKETQAKIAEINASAAAYVAYQEKLDYVTKYLAEDDTFFGDDRSELEEYLQSSDEPSADFFTNGGALYIVDNHTLTTEEIQAETQAVQDKLNTAIANGFGIGSELTSLIADPKFLESAEPWEGYATGSLGIGGVDATGMKVLEAFGGTFDIYQDITGLRNGYYEVRMNGAFRCLPWAENHNYCSQFYVNDVTTYIKNYFDENQPVETAEDGVNCNLSVTYSDLSLSDEEGNAYAYVPQGPAGASIHFAYGRYENRLVVAVTDGTMRIGVKNTGTGNSNDWTTFSNFRLFYQGDLEDASSAMDATLEEMGARAAMINQYISDGSDFTYYPNYAQALKDQLTACVAEIETAVEPADKEALIKKFSAIFEEMPACKRAYRNYAADIESYYGAVNEMGLEAAEMDPETAFYNNTWDKLINGDYSTAEAEAEAELKARPFYAAVFGVEPELVDGYYQIAEPANMVWYAKKVNAGNPALSAKMVADIDMAGYSLDIMSASTPFQGHFDGQGHKFSNIKIETTENYAGIWSLAGDGSIFENFVLDETCSIIGGSYTGIIGGTPSAAGTTTIRNIGNEGYVKGVKNSGAIFGCNMGATATVLVDNCYSCGTVEGDNESGALTGYLKTGHIYNSWSSAAITGYYTPANKPFALIYGDTKNNWMCTEYALNADFDIKKCTAEEVENGELCWKLNEYSGVEETIWYQTIGVDAHPVLDPTHGVVQKDENGNLTNGVSEIIAKTSNNNAIYDLQGRRVSKTTKGVYVVGNKKMLVK